MKPSAYIEPMRAINGAGTCGMDSPFRVSAFAGGSVEVSPRATLACPMTASVDRWVNEDIQPAAMAWFGQPVVKIKQMSSYSCRNMNGAARGKISEHAFGNGLDIGGFELADGRLISVKTGWKGKADEAGFLRTVQAGACERFSVVLAPGSNIYHYDHIHVDLMRRTSGRTTCKPAAVVPRPPNLPIYKAPPPSHAAPMASARESLPPQPAQTPRPAYPPATAYPSQAGAPMPLGAGGAPSAYGHGVDPNYQPPAYPAAPSAPATPYPASSDYPAAPPAYPVQPYPVTPSAPARAPQPARTHPPGIPLPPAAVPLAKWLGLDKTTTGSTGNVRSFTSEREFASPIGEPAAEAGAD